MTARARGALALLATLLAPARPAAAAELAPAPPAASPLTLTIDRCPQLDEPRLRALVAIELGTVAAPGAKGGAVVRLACAGDRAAIEVAAGPTWPAARADLNLAEAAEPTRLRVLALTITELVSLAWSPPPSSPPVAPAPGAARADLAVRATPAAPAPRFDVQVGTSVRRMGRPAAWLMGVDVAARRRLGAWAALALDLRGETGDAAPAVATVTWRQLVATAALDLGLSRGGWAVTASPGWSLGLARLTAKPTAVNASGGTLDGVWSGPTLALGARRALGSAAFVALDVAGGLVTRRVVGLRDGASAIFEIDGPWALAQLGVGLTF